MTFGFTSNYGGLDRQLVHNLYAQTRGSGIGHFKAPVGLNLIKTVCQMGWKASVNPFAQHNGGEQIEMVDW